MGSGNWIVDNLNSALEMWNGRLAEIWQLISTSPESFKGGGVWNVIVNINDGLKAVGYDGQNVVHARLTAAGKVHRLQSGIIPWVPTG